MHHPAHDDGVAGEGAHIGVVAGGGGGGELDDLLAVVIQELGMPNDVAVLGDETGLETFGTHDEGLVGDLVDLTWLHEQDVMRHEVGIGEGELHFLPGLHGEFLHVVGHALWHGGDADGGEFWGVAENA